MRFNRVKPRNQPDTIDLRRRFELVSPEFNARYGPARHKHFCIWMRDANNSLRWALLKCCASFWSRNSGGERRTLLRRIREISFNVANSSGDLTRSNRVKNIERLARIWIEIKYLHSREIIESKQFCRKWFYNGERFMSCTNERSRNYPE